MSSTSHDVAARLRTATSRSELMELAAGELRALGFARVLLSQVDGDNWIPLVVNHGSGCEHVPSPSCQLNEAKLTRDRVEFDL